MNSVTLKRIAIIGAVLTVLLAIDGMYMLVTHYNKNETMNYNLPDGATVLIAAVLLLILTVVAFVLSNRPQVQAQSVQATVADSSETAQGKTSANESHMAIEPEV
ncbi:MAG TPA: hypothetical protein VGN34_28000 [Ktedonobacteraceae bacterium]|jgi:Ca2+/H+ antiporter